MNVYYSSAVIVADFRKSSTPEVNEAIESNEPTEATEAAE